MHDVGLGQDPEGLEEVEVVGDGLALLEATGHFDFLFESAPVAELVYEVVVVGSFEYFNEADDVGGVLNLGEGLNFVDGELLELGTHFEFLNFDDLDGHQLVGLLVEGPVHLPELSLPHHVVQHVVLDLFAHHVVNYRIYRIRNPTGPVIIMPRK